MFKKMRKIRVFANEYDLAKHQKGYCFYSCSCSGDEVNLKRINGKVIPKSNTYQTYIIIIDREQMKKINYQYNISHETFD